MNFKQVEFKQGQGTCETAYVGFGIELDVWEYNTKYMWAIGDDHRTLNKGRCKTREQAREKAQEAFQSYVTENLAKCCN